MRLRWPADYLDGQTPQAREASVTLAPTGMEIKLVGGSSFWWRYDEAHQTQGRYAGEPVRLERGDEALVITEAGFLDALKRLSPKAPIRGTEALPRLLGKATLAGIAAIALATSLYLKGLPFLADQAAARIPLSWEEKLGDLAIARWMDDRCPDPVPREAIDIIVAALAPGSRYDYQITVVKSPMVNALAAPGGRLVIFTGLLEKTRSPEELAGILAHEIQHVEQRHTTKALFRQFATQILLAAIVGNTKDLSAALETSDMLGNLHSSREYELEADIEGMKRLQRARIDSTGMLRAFETLEKETETLPQGLELFSTHPHWGERVTRLRLLATEAHYEPITLLPGVNWNTVRTSCR